MQDSRFECLLRIKGQYYWIEYFFPKHANRDIKRKFVSSSILEMVIYLLIIWTLL